MGVPRPAPVVPAGALLLVRGGRVGRGPERLRLLENYSQTLLTTVARVSQSPVLTDFFVPHPLDLEPTLPPGSLVTLPAPEERPPHPAGSLYIRSLEAQSLRCLQPFHAQDTRGRPFHAQAQEALDVLLRHPSGWWLVENEGWQTAWFPAPYLKEVVLDQGHEGRPLGGSGMKLILLPMATTITVQCVAMRGYRNHLSCNGRPRGT
ncbi:hypothetical protein MC885_014136 [Smutsia gigantea]|nr:hypothetical protein MC885_014136 [Smutsia gigantea]